MLSQTLHVGAQVPGRVLFQLRTGTAPTCASLIEDHDAVVVRIEETPRLRITTGSGAAMHEDNRPAVGIAALLIVNLVNFGDPQVAVVEWLYLRIEASPGIVWRLNRHVSGTG